MKLKSESEVAQSCLTLATLWTAAYQAPPSTGFSRQKYWSRVPTVNKMVRKAVLGCNVKNDRMISVCFQGKPFNITIIQVYALTGNAEAAEVERFYEDLQDLLELTPKKDVLFIIRACNAHIESKEIPGATGKFCLGVRNEAGQRLTEFCQENATVIANTLFQQHKRRLYDWTSPDG